MDNARQTLGQDGEALVANYLKATRHAQIIATNWRPSRVGVRGECDVVALMPTQPTPTVVFVEVKTRHASRHGFQEDVQRGLESIARTKRTQLAALAEVFIQQHPQWQRCPIRVDCAVVITPNSGQPEIYYLENCLA